MAAGDFGVYRSDDGGLSWRELVSKYPRRPPVGVRREEWISWHSVWMSGPEEIWLGGGESAAGPGKGALLHSVDGGRSWKELLGGRLTDAAEVAVTTDAVWVLSRFGSSFCRFDRGPWQPAPFPEGFQARRIVFPGDVRFASGYAGYVLGRRAGSPAVLRTVDSGRTWRGLKLPSSAGPRLTSIRFVTSTQGWVGGNGVLFHTVDGGTTWSDRTAPAQDQPLNDLIFHRGGRGWAALDQPFDGIGKLIHEHTLFFTPDGGATWTPVLGGWKDIHRLWSLGPGSLWGVGNTPGFVPSDLVVILKP